MTINNSILEREIDDFSSSVNSFSQISNHFQSIAAFSPPPRTSKDGPIRSVGLALKLTLQTPDLLEEAGEEYLVWQGSG